MICYVESVAFTRGSPFGEQWWAFTDLDGNLHKRAMWLNALSENWPYPGDMVEIQDVPPRVCHTGGGGSVSCEPCAQLIKVLERANALSFEQLVGAIERAAAVIVDKVPQIPTVLLPDRTIGFSWEDGEGGISEYEYHDDGLAARVKPGGRVLLRNVKDCETGERCNLEVQLLQPMELPTCRM